MEDYAPEQLTRNSIRRRAIEAVIWGMPAVNSELMFRAMREANADYNQVVYWSRPVTWKRPDAHAESRHDLPDAHVQHEGGRSDRVEIPPAGADESITGSVDDAWQTAIEDVGPAGVDKGKGGKYLILPPGYTENIPEGYIAMPSATYAGYALLRSNLKSGSDADIAKAAAYGRRVRFYPLSAAASPPETRYVDAVEDLFDSTIPYNARFFETLDRFVQREPWLERDKVMINQLKSVGIEKGKPFSPDADTRQVLDGAASEARAYLDQQYEGIFVPPFNAGTHWALPAAPGVSEGIMSNFAAPDAYPVDGRGIAYSMAFFSAKHLGEGQYYLMTIVDKKGQPLHGGATYRLNVPANAPVRLYWSATTYDRATHALIRDSSWSSRSSHTPGLAKNADGSVDIYFGPKAPTGMDLNWVLTDPGGEFGSIVPSIRTGKAIL